MNKNQMPYGLLGPIPTYNPGLLAPKTGALGGYNMNDPSHIIGTANIADVANGSTAYVPNGNPINPGMNASKMPADWVQRLFGANKQGAGYGRGQIAGFLQHMNPEAIQRLVTAGHIPNDWASQLGIQSPNLPNGSMPGGMGNPLPGQASSR